MVFHSSDDTDRTTLAYSRDRSGGRFFARVPLYCGRSVCHPLLPLPRGSKGAETPKPSLVLDGSVEADLSRPNNIIWWDDR